MKIAPISGDLIVKLALGVGVGIAAWFAYKKVTGAAGNALSSIYDTASNAAGAVGAALDPTADTNIFYRASNVPGQWLSGDKHWTLGGWVYDVTH